MILDSSRPSHLIEVLKPIEHFAVNVVMKHHTNNAHTECTIYFKIIAKTLCIHMIGCTILYNYDHIIWLI